MPSGKETISDFDRLSKEIFSILEANFLFGGGGAPAKPLAGSGETVRILSIDGGASASDAVLAALALSRLETSLQRRTGDPAARVSVFFDAAAGSGAGGVLAAMLFVPGPDGLPLFTAADALRFLVKHRRRLDRGGGALTKLFRGGGRAEVLRRMFGASTLRGAVKPLLVPCYDLASGSPLLFSRADAAEANGRDYRMWEVCAATCAAAPFELKSVDGRTAVSAVGGGLAMGNPTAAAITHVLNNKRDFPLAAGVQDLLVLSIAGGEAAPPPADELVRIVHKNSAESVDQAVALAFRQNRDANYLRIQGHGEWWERYAGKSKNECSVIKWAEEVLEERNVGSVLLRGKQARKETNAERLESFACELVKEQIRRQNGPPHLL